MAYYIKGHNKKLEEQVTTTELNNIKILSGKHPISFLYKQISSFTNTAGNKHE